MFVLPVIIKAKEMRINKAQRMIMLAGLLLFVSSSLFPPWIKTYKDSGTYSESPGKYRFIASPPVSEHIKIGTKLDLQRLLIQ